MWKSQEYISILKNINSNYRGSPQAPEISARDIDLLVEEDISDMLNDDEFWEDKQILERIDSTGKIFSIQPENSLNFSSLFNSFWLLHRNNVYVHEVLRAFVTLVPGLIGPWRPFDPLGKLEIDSDGLLKKTADPKVPMMGDTLKPIYMISGIDQKSGTRVYILLEDYVFGIKITKVKVTNTRVSGKATVLEEKIVVVTISNNLVTVNFKHNFKYYTLIIDVSSSIPKIVESTIKTELETSDATINDLIELKTSDATINNLIELYKNILDFRTKVFEPLTYIKNLSDDYELSIAYFDHIQKDDDKAGIHIKQTEEHLRDRSCVTETIFNSTITINEELINSLGELKSIMLKEPTTYNLYAINSNLILSTKFCENFYKNSYHYYLLLTPRGDNPITRRNKFDLTGLADQTRHMWGWFVVGIKKQPPDVQPPDVQPPDVQPPVLQPQVAASLRAMLDATTPQVFPPQNSDTGSQYENFDEEDDDVWY